MKNLLIYLNPEKKFNKEHSLLVKIQIDNSLRLGWDRNDIVLVTNFPYEYKGVKAIIVPNYNYCDFRPLSTKTLTVAYLLREKMIENDLYWVHDFDAYQLEPFEPRLEKSWAFSDYGYSKKPSLGSYFFTKVASEIINFLAERIYVDRTEDERALADMIEENAYNVNYKYQKLNITYNFGMRRVEYNWKRADKPLKVVHFHPWGKDLPTLDIFMYGKNKLGFPLMSKELIDIFNKHEIR